MYQILLSLSEKRKGIKNIHAVFSYYLERNENEELVPFQTEDINVLKEKISYLSKKKPLNMILPIKTLEICSDITIKETNSNEQGKEEEDINFENKEENQENTDLEQEIEDQPSGETEEDQESTNSEKDEENKEDQYEESESLEIKDSSNNS